LTAARRQSTNARPNKRPLPPSNPAAMSDTAKLIDELLARQLLPETRNDLETFKQDLEAGQLDAADERYVRGLHARLLGDGNDDPIPVERTREELEDEIDDLKADLADRDARIAELEREVAALRNPSTGEAG